MPPPAEQSVAQAMGVTDEATRQSKWPWNFYRCTKCHVFYTTFDANAGITPFRLQCADRPSVIDGQPRRMSRCNGTMLSAFYPEPAMWPKLAPRVAEGEWYAPPKWEREKLRKKNPRMYEWVRIGGLLLRPAYGTHTFPEVPDATDQG